MAYHVANRTYQQELFLRIQYPDELGQVNQCVLDNLLANLQKVLAIDSIP